MEVKFFKKYVTPGLGDHIKIVLLCDECTIVCGGGAMKARGKFKIRTKSLWETNLHFRSELRELVARKVKKIILALVGIPRKFGRAIFKCQKNKAI